MAKISEIQYEGGLRTTSIHLQSGKQIITDAPTDNNGRGEAFSPTDLLSTSLGCCMLTIMGIVAARSSINLEGTKVDITKIMGTEPRRVVEIVVVYNIVVRTCICYVYANRIILDCVRGNRISGCSD